MTSNKPKKPVQVVEFIAPEQRKPSTSLASSSSSSSQSRKRTREDDSSSHGVKYGSSLLHSSSSSSKFSTLSSSSLPSTTLLSSADSLKDIYKSVTSLGATSLHGKEKKIFEAKQLAELGVHVEHKIKMPYKMYKGIMKARHQRETKQTDYARLAGLVVPKLHDKDKKEGKRRRYGDDSDNDDDPTPHNIRGPVMYLTGNKGQNGGKKQHHHYGNKNKFRKNK